MTVSKAPRENYLINRNARLAVNIIVMIYVIAKMIFYLYTVDIMYLPVRFLSSCLALIIAIPLNNNPRMSKRLAAVVIPLVLATIETVTTAVTGGEMVYYVFLVGTIAVSFVYVDTIGLLIFLSYVNAISITCSFVLKIPMLGSQFEMTDQIMQFISMNIVGVTFFVACVFSVGRHKTYAITSETFDMIMETTPSSMLVIDEKTNVRYISKSLVDRLGLADPEFALGRPVLDLFGSGDIKMMFHEVMEQGGFVEKAFSFVVNGNTWHCMLRSSPLGGGKVARFFEWGDITQLVEAKNEAEAATKAKGDFLARMSHEIRTPMNAIVGMSELVLREDVPPSIYEHALGIKHAGASLISILNDILDYSKIESGKLEIISSEYMLTSMINDVVSVIRMRLFEKPVLFVVNIDSALPNKLIGDEVRIRQILLNLLSNAVKYTRRGFISLSIVGDIGPDSVVLNIDVTDSGIGIKSEDLGKLFNDFVQVDMKTNKGVQGTGLGLSIASSLCTAMNGSISVCSQYGSGSTFTVTLPQRFETAERLAYVPDPETKQVLLYETRSTYADSISRTLENLGVDCKCVHNQSEFHSALEGFPYPFVFASSFLFDTTRSIIEKLKAPSKLVLLADNNETSISEKFRSIAMPAYVVSIANMLNDVISDSGYNMIKEANITFMAPAARILIVDDIRTNLKVAEGLMAPYQMRVDSCTSGADAIEMIKANSYDLVFMDHMMPGMDGIEAACVIRALEDGSGYFANLPIVALTANAAFGVRELFLKSGMNDFLAKPIETPKLNSVLEQWLPREKQEKYVERKAAQSAEQLEIDGVDVGAGIASTGGRVDIYRKILSVFHKDGCEKLTQIGKCLKNGDMKHYIMYVHALKSASASIGAAKVSELAKDLEDAGRKGDMFFVEKNTPVLLDRLVKLLDGIGGVITAEDGDEPDEPDIDRSALKDLLTRLKDALGSMDMSVIDTTMSGLQSQSWGKGKNDTLEQISESVLVFEYEQASKYIDTLLESL